MRKALSSDHRQPGVSLPLYSLSFSHSLSYFHRWHLQPTLIGAVTEKEKSNVKPINLQLVTQIRIHTKFNFASTDVLILLLVFNCIIGIIMIMYLGVHVLNEYCDGFFMNKRLDLIMAFDGLNSDSYNELRCPLMLNIYNIYIKTQWHTHLFAICNSSIKRGVATMTHHDKMGKTLCPSQPPEYQIHSNSIHRISTMR